MTTIRGFVSHAFADAAYDGGTAAFRQQVEDLVQAACDDFLKDQMSVDKYLFFEGTSYGEPLLDGVRGQIRAADFLLADISQADTSKPVNPNVMYEIGYAMALEKPILVMRRNAHPAPPTDIGDLLAGAYDTLAAIPGMFRQRMIDIIEKTLARADRDSTRTGRLIQKVWFPPETRAIHIICAREHHPTDFSEDWQPNYVHIDNFEDRDALLELSAFFARQYPLAKVVHHLADDMPAGVKDCDLVVLGGPGCGDEEGNAFACDLMGMLGSRVDYPSEGDGIVWSGEPLRETKYVDDDDNKGVLADWGAVLAAPNPYNPVSRVVLLHGTTTYGTLAAATALIDTLVAMRNYGPLEVANITNRLTGAFDFEALVQVEVDSGKRIKPSKIQAGTIIRIKD